MSRAGQQRALILGLKCSIAGGTSWLCTDLGMGMTWGCVEARAFLSFLWARLEVVEVEVAVDDHPWPRLQPRPHSGFGISNQGFSSACPWEG